jgi:hypothetical protein
MFKVKWQGWGNSKNSWEPVENFGGGQKNYYLQAYKTGSRLFKPLPHPKTKNTHLAYTSLSILQSVARNFPALTAN